MSDIADAMGFALESAFKGLIVLGVAATITVGAGAYYLGHRNQEGTKYKQTYSLAVQLADRNSNGSLDAGEFAELYRRAGLEPVTYNADKQEVKANKLKLSDLEKAIASYKQ